MLHGQLSPVCRVSTRKPLHNTLLVRGHSIVRGAHCLVLECTRALTLYRKRVRKPVYPVCSHSPAYGNRPAVPDKALCFNTAVDNPPTRSPSSGDIVTLLSAFVRAAKTSLTSPSTCPFFENVFIFLLYYISGAHLFAYSYHDDMYICPRIVFVRG